MIIDALGSMGISPKCHDNESLRLTNELQLEINRRHVTMHSDTKEIQ